MEELYEQLKLSFLRIWQELRYALKFSDIFKMFRPCIQSHHQPNLKLHEYYSLVP